jgi:hypothetical protein
VATTDRWDAELTSLTFIPLNVATVVVFAGSVDPKSGGIDAGKGPLWWNTSVVLFSQCPHAAKAGSNRAIPAISAIRAALTQAAAARITRMPSALGERETPGVSVTVEVYGYFSPKYQHGFRAWPGNFDK